MHQWFILLAFIHTATCKNSSSNVNVCHASGNQVSKRNDKFIQNSLLIGSYIRYSLTSLPHLKSFDTKYSDLISWVSVFLSSLSYHFVKIKTCSLVCLAHRFTHRFNFLILYHANQMPIFTPYSTASSIHRSIFWTCQSKFLIL